MHIKKLFSRDLPTTVLAIWMLEASVRRVEHIQRGIALQSELITAPGNAYSEWFALTEEEKEHLSESTYAKALTQTPFWNPPEALMNIRTEKGFFEAIEKGTLPITHPLTDTGIERFTKDWQAILTGS